MTPEFLRQWRRSRGWTQPEAARWYGCDVRTWRRFERGETPIALPLQRRIADVTMQTYFTPQRSET